MADRSMIALCLGGAARVHGDALNAISIIGRAPDLVVACNDVAALWAGEVDALASHHPESIPRWLALRAEAGQPPPRRVVIPNHYEGHPATDIMATAWDGGSGLYTAEVAIKLLGAHGAILCGVPLDPNEPHVVREGPWPAAPTFRSGFRAALAAEGGRIRSMSGWTKSVLGVPTADWIDALSPKET